MYTLTHFFIRHSYRPPNIAVFDGISDAWQNGQLGPQNVENFLFFGSFFRTNHSTTVPPFSEDAFVHTNVA